MEPKPQIIYHKSRAEIAIDTIYKKLAEIYSSAKGQNVSIKYAHIRNPLCDEKCRRLAWILLLYLFDDSKFGKNIVIPKQLIGSIINSNGKLKLINMIFGETKLRPPKAVYTLSRTERYLLEHISKHKIITISDLAERTALIVDTVRHYVKKLKEKGVIETKEIKGIVFIRAVEI